MVKIYDTYSEPDYYITFMLKMLLHLWLVIHYIYGWLLLHLLLVLHLWLIITFLGDTMHNKDQIVQLE